MNQEKKINKPRSISNESLDSCISTISLEPINSSRTNSSDNLTKCDQIPIEIKKNNFFKTRERDKLAELSKSPQIEDAIKHLKK